MKNDESSASLTKNSVIVSGSINGKEGLIKRLVATNTTVLVLLLFAVVIIGLIFTPNMLQKDNVINVMRAGSIVGILGLGMSAAILVGEIDISMGSLMSLSAMLGGMLISGKFGDIIAILATCIFGCLLGLINGLIVTKFKVGALISTLGAMLVFEGFAQMTTAGQPILVYGSPIYVWMGKGNLLSIPISTVFFLVFAIILTIMLQYTRFGKEFYFTGANTRAAWIAGVNVDRLKNIAFIISGFCGAVAGIFLSGQTDQLSSNIGSGSELTGIAIAVIGGTALGGGKGSVLGTVIGAVIYEILLNILSLSGLGTYAEQILKGGLLVIIVISYQVVNDRKAGK
ncbi:MAG: ABC transporter permease [Ruminiclostridium sp.]